MTCLLGPLRVYLTLTFFCITGVSDAMHSGSGCNFRGVGPQRLPQGKHRGHPVDLRVAEDREERLQTDMGGECHPQVVSAKYIWQISRECVRLTDKNGT